jgi:hypothetical protein
MKNNESGRRTRFTVDLSDYPDLVAIYLGLRVNSIRGLLPALEFGPKLKQASPIAETDFPQREIPPKAGP